MAYSSIVNNRTGNIEEEIYRFYSDIEHTARRIASKLPPSIIFEDLINSGIIGLMDAMNKYDPSKGIKFKTYAIHRIRGEILEEIRNLDWVPRRIRQKTNELERIYPVLEQRLGRKPFEEEVAAELGMKLEEFYKFRSGLVSIVSADSLNPYEDDGHNNLLKFLQDKSTGPFEEVKLLELGNLLNNALDELSDKERRVIQLYYYDNLTVTDIGKSMGVTQGRVSQIYKKALLKLRVKLKKAGIEEYCL